MALRYLKVTFHNSGNDTMGETQGSYMPADFKQLEAPVTAGARKFAEAKISGRGSVKTLSKDAVAGWNRINYFRQPFLPISKSFEFFK